MTRTEAHAILDRIYDDLDTAAVTDAVSVTVSPSYTPVTIPVLDFTRLYPDVMPSITTYPPLRVWTAPTPLGRLRVVQATERG